MGSKTVARWETRRPRPTSPSWATESCQQTGMTWSRKTLATPRMGPKLIARGLPSLPRTLRKSRPNRWPLTIPWTLHGHLSAHTHGAMRRNMLICMRVHAHTAHGTIALIRRYAGMMAGNCRASGVLVTRTCPVGALVRITATVPHLPACSHPNLPTAWLVALLLTIFVTYGDNICQRHMVVALTR